MTQNGAFKVEHDNGRGHTVYSEIGGKYYAQSSILWEKGGYRVPQARVRITKKSYMAMREKYHGS